MAPVARHKSILCQFVTFHDGAEPPHDPRHQQFSKAQLSALRPSDVVSWFSVKRCGVEEVGPDNCPTRGRSNSAKFWKKALSHFVVNRHVQCNSINNVGNPTRSQEINKFLREVILHETRRQGAPSQARRSSTREEFKSQQEILRDEGETSQIKCGMRAHNNFQFHLIGRVDDCAQATLDNF